MAHKAFALVPATWQREDLNGNTPRCPICGAVPKAKNHLHVGANDVYGRAGEKDSDGLLNLNLAEWLHFPRVLRIKRFVGIRGLSCRVGAFLAEKVSEGHLWALVMLQDIHHELTGLRGRL